MVGDTKYEPLEEVTTADVEIGEMGESDSRLWNEFQAYAKQLGMAASDLLRLCVEYLRSRE